MARVVSVTEDDGPAARDADLRAVGARLRADIDQHFKRLRASSTALGRADRRSVDITGLLALHLPASTTRREVEIILRAAGFSVAQSPSDLLLQADVTLEVGFGYRIWVAVVIEFDRSNIKTIEASVLYSTF